MLQVAEGYMILWIIFHNQEAAIMKVHHHGMAHPQVVGGGDSPHIWRVAANTLNKQLWTADRVWSTSLMVGQGTNNSSPQKKSSL
jgi:hypothetical protein